MNLIKDDKAQAAGIIMFIVALFAIGFFYILLSGIEQPYLEAFNSLINNPLMHISQDNYDMMDGLFKYWWAIPIIALIILVIYAVKNSISETTQEAY